MSGIFPPADLVERYETAAPGKVVRYEARTSEASMLPRVRDLVDTPARRDTAPSESLDDDTGSVVDTDEAADDAAGTETAASTVDEDAAADDERYWWPAERAPVGNAGQRHGPG